MLRRPQKTKALPTDTHCDGYSRSCLTKRVMHTLRGETDLRAQYVPLCRCISNYANSRIHRQTGSISRLRSSSGSQRWCRIWRASMSSYSSCTSCPRCIASRRMTLSVIHTWVRDDLQQTSRYLTVFYFECRRIEDTRGRASGPCSGEGWHDQVRGRVQRDQARRRWSPERAAQRPCRTGPSLAGIP